MSGLPPVDLASAFGSPARSAGLTGLLPTPSLSAKVSMNKRASALE